MTSFENFTQKCSNVEPRLTVSFLWQVQICFLGFYIGRITDFVEDLMQKLLNTIKQVITRIILH